MIGDITLSMKDLEKVKILERVKDKRITQKDASKLLGKSERQVRRLFKRYLMQGAQGLPSRLKGRPSNHQLTQELKAKALLLLQTTYADCGPTFAAEKLCEKHGIQLSVETIRKLMIQHHLWSAHRDEPPSVHVRRARRASEGEMAQMDASPHDWFEGRGPRCALHVAIDDATSKIMAMRFELTESSEGYFALLHDYLLTHGRPLSFYVDRHAIFKVNRKDPLSGDEPRCTEFGRALQDLGIKLIHARSPQAKGRVERVNRTLQDRLIKEMRLAQISDIEAANRFLTDYITWHNARFSVPATNRTNLHRPLEEYHDLERILTTHEYRVIQKDLTFSYQSTFYQVIDSQDKHRLIGEKVLLWKDSEGCLRVELNGHALNVLLLSQVIETGENSRPLIWKEKKKRKINNMHPYRKRFKIVA